MEYRIDLLWDDDARVWVATSNDVPGLVLESGSVDALIERVKIAAPELLELNDKLKDGTLCFHMNRLERMYV